MNKYVDDNYSNSTDVYSTYVDTHERYSNRYILPVKSSIIMNGLQYICTNCTDAYNIHYPIQITKLFRHKTLRFRKVYNTSS